MEYDFIEKIILIGNSAVGKTNIVSRLSRNDFLEDYVETIGVDYTYTLLKVENRVFKAQIWDTSGREKYQSIIEPYFRGVKGAFLIYDITNKMSFDCVDEWLKKFKELADEKAHVIIIGNKCDLKDKRQVTKEQGELKAKKYGADFMETSAFTGENIQKAFEKMMREIEKEALYLVKKKEKSSSNENKNLNDELEHYKNEYEKLKKEYDKLKLENEELNNELIKSKKIISNIGNKSNENTNLNEINNLKNIVLQKDNEILNLKSKLQNLDKNNKKSVDYEDILFVHFISSDQNINCPIKCLKTDTFAEVEEKLYQKYQEYRETNNNFLSNGRIILRFKKIFENKINDGDKIELIKLK